MSDLQKYKNKQLQDPEFKTEYEHTRPEFEIMHALVDARISQNMTQKELAEKSGVRQSNISRIENGTCSPTIATLEALASGIAVTPSWKLKLSTTLFCGKTISTLPA